MNYNVERTSRSDLDFIYFLFEKAIEYQRKNGYTVWKGYDKNALISDIENQLQYKVVKDDEILCVFSICFSDDIIWRDKEKGDALYIHRMVVNPKHRGQKHFAKVLEWAIQLTIERELSCIRMDTWSDNPKIVGYYKSYGFRFVENYTTPNTKELPEQHRSLGITLLQYDLKQVGMKDFIDEIDYFGLSARIKRLSDHLNNEARKMYTYLNFDIEPNWYLVFLLLKEKPLSVTELAKQLHFSHPAIVKIVKKMKERGYVKSRPDKNDSRKQILLLTAKSKSRLPEFEEEWDNIRIVIQDCCENDFLESIRTFERSMREESLFERLKARHLEAEVNDNPT